MTTQTTVIRRVPVRIVPGWIAASPSRASQSSNAFVKPWASATVPNALTEGRDPLGQPTVRAVPMRELDYRAA